MVSLENLASYWLNPPQAFQFGSIFVLLPFIDLYFNFKQLTVVMIQLGTFQTGSSASLL